MTTAFRKTLVPALAALVAAAGLITLTTSNAEAGWRGRGFGHPGGFVQRHHGFRGGAVAAGVIGGLALGAVAAHAARPRYYAPSHSYEADYAPAYGGCFKQAQPVYDNWGNFAGYRKIRVCN